MPMNYFTNAKIPSGWPIKIIDQSNEFKMILGLCPQNKDLLAQTSLVFLPYISGHLIINGMPE